VTDKWRLNIGTPCRNAEGNVDELYVRIGAPITDLDRYRFELIFIDR